MDVRGQEFERRPGLHDLPARAEFRLDYPFAGRNAARRVNLPVLRSGADCRIHGLQRLPGAQPEPRRRGDLAAGREGAIRTTLPRFLGDGRQRPAHHQSRSADSGRGGR